MDVIEDLARAFSAAGNLGEPLPTVYRALADKTAHVRRGTYLLIAGAPGRGKSLLALNLVIETKVRALYFSPDCNVAEQTYRAAAKLSGDTLDEVEAAFRQKKAGYYTDLISHVLLPRVRFVWDSPTLHDMNLELNAYATAFGDYPELIVVDNVKNVYAANEEANSLRLTSDYLKELAHRTHAAVIGLHHLDGDYDDGTLSPPINAVRWKITKDPEAVWTLWGSDQGNNMHVNIVKNRGGKASAGGFWRATLRVDFARADVKR